MQVFEMSRNAPGVMQDSDDYILLAKDFPAAQLESKSPTVIEKYANAETDKFNFRYVFHLQPLRRIHLYSAHLIFDMVKRGDANKVFGCFASLAISIACLGLFGLARFTAALTVVIAFITVSYQADGIHESGRCVAI